MNFLNQASDSKLVTKKRNIANNQSNANYGLGNEIFYNIENSRSNFCDYKDAYILVRGNITVAATLTTQVSLRIVHHLLNVWQKLMEQQ